MIYIIEVASPVNHYQYQVVELFVNKQDAINHIETVFKASTVDGKEWSSKNTLYKVSQYEVS
jgi:hypothetical protein